MSTSNLQFTFFIPLLQEWAFVCHKTQCLPRNDRLDGENQQK